MSDTPLVSVGVPSYNHARFLPAALDSVLAQTYPNIEIIIVDDGSTDESLSVARRYAERYPEKIRVFTHPNNVNRGISETVNLVFTHTRGKYWMGLASDDVLYKDKIEKQADFLEKNPHLGFVYCYADYINRKGEKIPGRFGGDITNEADPLEAMLFENHIPGMTVLMRLAVVRQIGDHADNLVYSDWDFWIRALALCKAGFIDESLMGYRVHESNTSVGISNKTQFAHIRNLYYKLKERVAEKSLDEKYLRIIDEQIKNLPARESREYLSNYYKAISDNRRGAAVAALGGALRASPQTVLRPRLIASVIKQALLGAVKKAKKK